MAQKINSSQISGQDYSTSEQDTGQKWVDGKPIYRKVLTGTVTVASDTVDDQSHTVTGLTEIINVGGYFSETTTVSVPFAIFRLNTSGAQYSSGMVVKSGIGDGHVLIRTISGATRTSRPYYAVIEYIK